MQEHDPSEENAEFANAGHISSKFMLAQRGFRTLHHRLSLALEPMRLTPVQFSVLEQLRGTTDLSVGQLAKNLGCDQTRVSAQIGVLLRRALLELHVERDRRFRRVELTPQGRDLLEVAMQLWESTMNDLSREVGTDAQRVINSLAALSFADSGNAGQRRPE
ncbi:MULTISPECIES: MarR family winged helix-turn-helix transcriptional regulator [Burkholderiaceae]|uniref:DNA-binding MarR family transcriptional regulator n=1 Tax=Paraburkholderia bryophila TaxID=420952 RepID=A0A7Y9WTT4_9BURK|nr:MULTISPECIES: MarR family winged helix-turn-helix transcriptional regulator [Burkholderiaceae]NYH25966.1 DNA-binding MarR family transcriptional regulator [Paraburkholderia bryophila]